MNRVTLERRKSADVLIAIALCCALLAAGRAPAHDWPQLHGPQRDGVYRGSDVFEKWPDAGPKVLWEKPIGTGFSGPAVADGRLIVFHRRGPEEIIACFEAVSGKDLWTYPYPTAYRDDFGFDNGPRGTPAIDSGRVYTFGAEGVLTCVDASNGKRLWNVDTHEKFQVKKGFFGAACSPLVDAGRVLVVVGGSGDAGIVAFDAEKGKVVWKATDHEASHSSPVVAQLGTERHAFFFTRRGLVDLDPATGRVRFEERWRPRMNASVNGATPLVVGDRVFVSTSYHTGGLLVRVRGDRHEKVWSGDEVLSNHYATSVHHKRYLYGIHGRQEYKAHLRCVELETGKVQWSKERFGTGSLIVVGDRLLILHEDGDLILAAASPEEFRSHGSSKVLGSAVRAYPALANGLLYARDGKKLVCVDLREHH